MTMQGKQAPYLDGLPIVASTVQRNARFASPDTDQRVHNKETGYIERYDGAQWVADISTGRGGDSFNVRSYGAKGDGITDDTTAIMDAANAAGLAGGGDVVFPRGRYLHTGIVLTSAHDGVRFVGYGRGSVLLRATGATPLYPIQLTGCTGVEILYLKVDSGYSVYAATGVYAMLLTDITDCVVAHNYVTGYTEDGIRIEGTSTGNQINYNRVVSDTGNYPNTASSGIALVSALFGEFNYPIASATAATVTDNEVVGNRVTGGRWGVSVRNSSGNVVAHNRCHNQTDRNIVLSAGSSHNSVTGNRCRQAGGANIILSVGCSHNAITGNTCLDASVTRLLSGEMNAITTYYDSDYNTITGNTIKSPTNFGVWVAYGCRNSTVSGNTILGGSGACIRLAQGNDGVGLPPSGGGASIYVDRDLSDITVVGNTCVGGAAAVQVIRDAGASSSKRLTVSGNSARGQTSIGYAFANTDDLVFNPGPPTGASSTELSLTAVNLAPSSSGVGFVASTSAPYIWGVDMPRWVFNAVLAADVSVTLSATGARLGSGPAFIRSATATGAFNLNIKNHDGTTIKAMGTAGSRVEVLFDGANWILADYGTF